MARKAAHLDHFSASLAWAGARTHRVDCKPRFRINVDFLNGPLIYYRRPRETVMTSSNPDACANQVRRQPRRLHRRPQRRSRLENRHGPGARLHRRCFAQCEHRAHRAAGPSDAIGAGSRAAAGGIGMAT
jgi:hypothetical protein